MIVRSPSRNQYLPAGASVPRLGSHGVHLQILGLGDRNPALGPDSEFRSQVPSRRAASVPRRRAGAGELSDFNSVSDVSSEVKFLIRI
eukprot:747471-Hanusia_phi.AAC.1